jgi:hypothetical protein
MSLIDRCAGSIWLAQPASSMTARAIRAPLRSRNIDNILALLVGRSN